MTTDKLTEGQAIDEIDKILSNLLEDEKDNRPVAERILKLIAAKYNVSVGGTAAAAQSGRVRRSRAGVTSAGSTSKKRVKSSAPSLDKMLNLNPDDNQSWAEFSGSKNPRAAEKKVVVAVYYLTHILKLTAISANQAYTCFRHVGWKLPADFMNALHRTGSLGWLDTSERENIIVTPAGINLVEHRLPEGGNNGTK